jgi:hypothetical protein
MKLLGLPNEKDIGSVSEQSHGADLPAPGGGRDNRP